MADPVSRMPLIGDRQTSIASQVASYHLGALTSPASAAAVHDHTVWPPASMLLEGYTIDCGLSKQVGCSHDSTGLLYHDQRLVLPNALGIRQMVFGALHSSPFAGHKGLHATSKLIKRDFYWPNMDADIRT